MEEGGSAHLLTLTLRHDRKTDLAQALGALARAWSGMTSGKAWARLSNIGEVQWVRGMDVTHGRNGWHPHVHVLLLLGEEFGTGDELAQSILARWRRKLSSIGWDSMESAQDHQRVDDPEKAAAYAVAPAAVYEPTAMAMKRARKDSGSRTPFEILSSAVGGNRRDKGLWVEYVKAVKGRQQATCSSGLSFEWMEPSEETDRDPIDIVAGLSREALLEMDKKGLTAEMLDVVEDKAGDPAGVRSSLSEFLSKLETRAWRVFEYGQARQEADAARADARAMAEHAAEGGEWWTRPPDRHDRAIGRLFPNPALRDDAQDEVRTEARRVVERMKSSLSASDFESWKVMHGIP